MAFADHGPQIGIGRARITDLESARTLRKSAEEAATALYRKLRIKDCQLKVSWGRSQKSDGREVRL